MAAWGRTRLTLLGALLAATGVAAVCCVGPVLLLVAATSVGAWVVHSQTFVVSGLGLAGVLIIAGLVWWRRRACPCPVRPPSPGVKLDR